LSGTVRDRLRTLLDTGEAERAERWVSS
jgi:hypothetical protein